MRTMLPSSSGVLQSRSCAQAAGAQRCSQRSGSVQAAARPFSGADCGALAALAAPVAGRALLVQNVSMGACREWGQGARAQAGPSGARKAPHWHQGGAVTLGAAASRE